MFDLYSSVYQRGSTIFYRGYDAKGGRVSRKVQYKPYLYIKSKSGNSEWKTLEDEPVDRVDFDSIADAKDFMKKYKDVSGFKIFGMDKFILPFLNDNHPKDINYRKERLCVGVLDIEVGSEGGFAPVEDPFQPVTTITLKRKHRGQETKYAFGYFEWPNPPEDVIYVQCKDEVQLLNRFIDIWDQCDLDIITGWFTEGFDIPYLVRRITRVLGEEFAEKLSPWGMINESTITDKKTGKESLAYEIVGIEHLDYMRLYKKFSYKAQESYSLNFTLQELGLPLKVDYTGSLDDLYKADFPKFMEYNVRDVDAVDDIDAKTNLMDQALTIAYDARIPIQDVFGTVKMWDQIVLCMLNDEKIVIPPAKFSSKKEQYAGAYVKEPRPGRHKWIASEDFAALYPSLIIWGNFSPETYRGRLSDYFDLQTLLARGITQEVKDFLKENNLSLAANMTVWDKSKVGIFPKLCKKYITDRKVYKKKMLAAKAKKEELKAAGTLTPELARELDFEIARCNNMQMARKIQINSLYGAIGNAFFRYYQLDFAEAITLSGQLAAMWTEVRLNEYMNKLFGTAGYEYVIYADTDSNYLTFDPIMEKMFGGKDVSIEKKIEFMDKIEQQKIDPFIQETLAELAEMMNAYEGTALQMKREALADAGIWLGKKTYVLSVYDNEGVKFAEPEIKATGIAMVKSSTPKVCREWLKKSVKIMLQGENKELIDFIGDARSKFMKLPFQEIATPSSCNGLRKYADKETIYRKGAGAHVKGALIFNNMIKKMGLDKVIQPISDGDKVKFVYLKKPNPTFEEVISCTGDLPAELGLDKFIDRDAAFEKGYISPVKSLAGAVGWKLEESGDLSAFFD